MVGRPKEFDCDQALEKAMGVFWHKGYEAASVQDLLDGMGINRGSMYDTFGDKHELFVKAVEHYGGTVVQKLTDTLDGPGSPLGNIRKLFAQLAEKAAAPKCRGCLVCNTAVELAPHDTEVAGAVRSQLTRIERAFRRALESAVEAGELPGEVPAATDLRALSRFLTNTVQGLSVLGKAGVGRAMVKDVVDVAMSVIK